MWADISDNAFASMLQLSFMAMQIKLIAVVVVVVVVVAVGFKLKKAPVSFINYPEEQLVMCFPPHA